MNVLIVGVLAELNRDGSIAACSYAISSFRTATALKDVPPLGHSDVRTTMVYTHVLARGGKAVRSPLDV
jgi:hypothetical protein